MNTFTKSILILFCSFACFFDVQSQEETDSVAMPKSSKNVFQSFNYSMLEMAKYFFDREKPPFIDNMYIGFGAGPETGLSFILPKISYYQFQNKKAVTTSYYGIEGCIGLVESSWYSLDCLYGIKKNIFTFDCSIGVFWFPKQKVEIEPIEQYFHCTLNPKIGIKFWKVWLKGGPSIFLYKDYPKRQNQLGLVDIVKIGNIYYNFELLISISCF